SSRSALFSSEITLGFPFIAPQSLQERLKKSNGKADVEVRTLPNWDQAQGTPFFASFATSGVFRILWLAELRVQFAEQPGIVRQRTLQNFRLLLRRRPVFRFDGFGEPGQFEVSVSKSRAVENVLEPGTAGNALRIEPVALDLHHAVIQSESEFRIDRA